MAGLEDDVVGKTAEEIVEQQAAVKAGALQVRPPPRWSTYCMK